MYRVFIPTKNRQQTMTTHRYFTDADYTIVVHTPEQRRDYHNALGIPLARIAVSHTTPDAYGLTRQREWICANLASPGEWFVFTDDNVQTITGLGREYDCEQNYEYTPVFRRDIQNEVAPDRLWHILNQMKALANRSGIRWCGFSVTNNAFYRTRHWQFHGYVSGKMMLVRNQDLTFDHTITMEDFRNSAHHTLLDGGVLINNAIHPVAQHYQPGGMGLWHERILSRRQDVERLTALYPGFFIVKSNGLDLRVALRTQKQVEQWRNSLLNSAPILL